MTAPEQLDLEPGDLSPEERRALVERTGPLGWQWCYAPDIAYARPAPFHVEALDWGWGLRPDERPKVDAFGLVVFRGGAKSATAEQIVAMCASRLTRRYVLYVSRTQEMADDHVASIGAMLASELLRADYPHLGRVRVDRAGSKEIWRHNRIRVGGVTVDAIGLDVNVRGARLGRYRPDLIVLDDVDSHKDSLDQSAKTITTITESIIPSGGEARAVLVAQNVPNQYGFVARLVDRTAPYLTGARIVGPVPAVEGLAYESHPDPDDPDVNRWRVVAGTPTWPDGYPLTRAEADLNLEGPDSFERERQHNRRAAGGMFDPSAWQRVHLADVPTAGMRWCRGWDFAASASEKNDRTAHVLMGRAQSGRIYITAAGAGWWPVSKVEAELQRIAHSDGRSTLIDIPKDPAQAGKDQAERRAAMLAGWPVHVTPQSPATGSKATRAQGLVAQQQAGNVHVVDDHPDPEVRRALLELVAECDAFTGGSQSSHDDLVDAASAAFNRLVLGVGPSGSSSALTASRVPIG